MDVLPETRRPSVRQHRFDQQPHAPVFGRFVRKVVQVNELSGAVKLGRVGKSFDGGLRHRRRGEDAGRNRDVPVLFVPSQVLEKFKHAGFVESSSKENEIDFLRDQGRLRFVNGLDLAQIMSPQNAPDAIHSVWVDGDENAVALPVHLNRSNFVERFGDRVGSHSSNSAKAASTRKSTAIVSAVELTLSPETMLLAGKPQSTPTREDAAANYRAVVRRRQ